jgi:hypothetical protein
MDECTRSEEQRTATDSEGFDLRKGTGWEHSKLVEESRDVLEIEQDPTDP